MCALTLYPLRLVQGVDLDKYDAARFVIINLLPLSNKQQTDAIRNQVSSVHTEAQSSASA